MTIVKGLVMEMRKKHHTKCITAYLNINSYRYKHHKLSDVFYHFLIDVLAIAETKLNKFFASHLYEKQNYKLFRRDRSFRGNFTGGMILYLNSSIPSDRFYCCRIK